MRWRAKFQLNTAATLLASLLGVLATGFAAIGLYLFLAKQVQPDLAAFYTACALMLLAIFILLLARFITSFSFTPPAKQNEDPTQGIQQILDQISDTGVTALVEKYPGRAVAATLAAGLVLGYSAEARTAVKAACREWLNEESDQKKPQ
jgi:hypothetical protein